MASERKLQIFVIVVKACYIVNVKMLVIKVLWLPELLWGFKQVLVIPSATRNLVRTDEIPRCARNDK